MNPVNDRSPVVVLDDVRFSYDDGVSWAVDGVNLTIHDGERIAIVGANGSGKSTLGRVIAALAAPDSGIVSLFGDIVFDGTPHTDRYRKARHDIGAVFQNPEDQIVTTVVDDDVAFGPENLGVAHARIGERVGSALRQVGMDDHAAADPTRMSGGQQQRVAIAGMLAMRPRMLVLDEPTAMLDESGRAEVMRVLDDLHVQGTTIVHITHSAVEAVAADRVIVMRDGRIVEDARSSSVAPPSPGSPWARELSDGRRTEGVEPPNSAAADLESSPGTRPRSRGGSPIITMSHVSFAYDRSHPVLRDVDLTVDAGETIAIMGRNGGGKSTLTRLLCALETPSGGSITVDGIDVARNAHGKSKPLRKRDRRRLRGTVGYVMQHPERQLFAQTVAEDVAYGPRNLGLSGDKLDERVQQTLDDLHIGHLAERSPFGLSGGQQRMVAIAGILACRPKILIMDEPTSSLDVDAAARIHRLLADLKTQGVTVLIVTHDEAEAGLADRVVELRDGRIMGHDDPGFPRPGQSSDERRTEKAESHYDGNRKHHRSFVARLDPRVKMVLTLVLMFTAFAIGTPAQLGVAAATVAVIMAAARMNPVAVLHSVRLFLALFVIMSALNVFFVRTGTPLAHLGPVPITDDGVWTAVVYAGRLALVVMLGAILLLTTTPTRLTDAFEALLRPLHRFGVHTGEIALVMSLALRFIPTLTGETQAIIEAQSARGGSIESGSPLQRFRALVAIIVPVFAGALRHADNLGLALDARCYEGGADRTHYRMLRLSWRDGVFAVFCALYLAALFMVPLI
ncbi:ATP-binding cassette domain-containing protein [Bifidobacterium sp. 82T24]|uniref:energy-coupling factor transporter ATPase n=1 Tax=Bifidobacterium pluvialisilvae TaxID=2834436 RepID=UPI001C59C19D|nr:energy-coupling factor transporter ATPase [Bifidobacterium pluvialisilvae]MBW3087166.1 ATP-binding cassette domain-containing protein [Bifidobacterium pluvialisilvae]